MFFNTENCHIITKERLKSIKYENKNDIYLIDTFDDQTHMKQKNKLEQLYLTIS